MAYKVVGEVLSVELYPADRDLDSAAFYAGDFKIDMSLVKKGDLLYTKLDVDEPIYMYRTVADACNNWTICEKSWYDYCNEAHHGGYYRTMIVYKES